MTSVYEKMLQKITLEKLLDSDDNEKREQSERDTDDGNRDYCFKIIKKHGFNIVGFVDYMFEDTFLFNTKKEAKQAYEYFEKNDKRRNEFEIVGWWYSINQFKKINKENDNRYIIETCKTEL